MTLQRDSDIKESVRELVIAAGAARVAFAEAKGTSDDDRKVMARWLAEGYHGEMAYMERYSEVRNDPRLLFEGAQTVICCAFDYRQSTGHPLFADYALGRDYHEVIRQRLTSAATEISARWGGETRICVDTAPIRERYWAAVSGLGFIGLNGQLIVDGIGSKVFLAEILWTEAVAPDRPEGRENCERCGACIKACPGKALDGRCGVDARRCLSYLTIEHRGELPDGLTLNGRIYGCDVCQNVCPHNRRDATTNIVEFRPTPELQALTAEDIIKMEPHEFNRIFRHSAVKRTKLTGLRRNALLKYANSDKSVTSDKSDLSDEQH